MYYSDNYTQFSPMIITLSKILNKEVRILRNKVDPYSFQSILDIGIFSKAHVQYKIVDDLVYLANLNGPAIPKLIKKTLKETFITEKHLATINIGKIMEKWSDWSDGHNEFYNGFIEEAINQYSAQTGHIVDRYSLIIGQFSIPVKNEKRQSLHFKQFII